MSRRPMILCAVVIAALAVVPALFGSFTVSLLNDIGIGALVALGLVLLTGVGGATCRRPSSASRPMPRPGSAPRRATRPGSACCSRCC